MDLVLRTILVPLPTKIWLVSGTGCMIVLGASVTLRYSFNQQVQNFSPPCDSRYGMIHSICKGGKSCVQNQF